LEAYEIIDRWMREPAPAVLATVIRVEGHAYRKPGAMMLLYIDGTRVGTISPGCLEDDLSERAPGVFDEARTEIIRYNLKHEEDALWGEAVGCGGIVDILLEPLTGEAALAICEVSEQLGLGEGAVLSRYRRGSRFSYRVTPITASEEDEYAGAGADVQKAGELLFTQKLASRPRLLLFGAGYDAEPVARIALALGFGVTVSDWRPRLLSDARFPGVERVCGMPADMVAALEVGPKDFTLVMGHQMQKDRALLEALLQVRPAYVGVIGSVSRIARLFDGLPMPSFVHAPAGLAIGAEGPEEIAISIAAELVAVRRRYQGGETHNAIENRGHLLSGRPKQQDGTTEAFPGVCRW